MRNWRPWLVCGLFGTLVAGCPQQQVQRNPFLGFTDEYGVAGAQQSIETGAAAGRSTETPFRKDMTVTFRNNHPSAELNVSFVAWVSVGSIRSAEQQDALLRGGYTQLTREARLGSAHTLPVGTFVYDGGGNAGATPVFLLPAQPLEGDATAAQGQGEGDGQGDDAVVTTSTTTEVVLITPDAMLAFNQPPVSCESVGFYYSDDAAPLTGVPIATDVNLFGGATGTGGFKTLAQFNVYECDPFRPGLFFSRGGAKQPNEYYEGENVTLDFNPAPNDDGDFCIVTVGAVGDVLFVTTQGSDEEPGEGGRSESGPPSGP